MSDDRRRRALAFAMGGLSWDLIAEQCGYASRIEAIEDVEQALTENPVDSLSGAATKSLQMARLSRLLSGVWTKAINGDNRSTEVASALIRQMMRYQGIEDTNQTPKKDDPVTASAYDELAARRPGTVNGPRIQGNGRRRGRRA